MTYKQPIKQILGSLLLLGVSFGEVIINEFQQNKLKGQFGGMKKSTIAEHGLHGG